jgi:hypothetical protein
MRAPIAAITLTALLILGVSWIAVISMGNAPEEREQAFARLQMVPALVTTGALILLSFWKVPTTRSSLAKLSLLLAPLLCACGPPKVDIPQGTYGSASGEETIEVSESQMRFRIALNGQRIDRTLTYQVWPDNRIQVYPMASQELVTGIGTFEWHWDGEQITQTTLRDEGVPPKLFRKVEGQELVPTSDQLRQATAVVDGYVRDSKNWESGAFRIEFNRREDAALVFWVLHSDDNAARSPGGGRSIEVHVDPANGRILKELAFQ